MARRRRLSIDVYFVLYLTAIVLLLGTAPLAQDAYQADLEEVIVRLVDTRFSVEVERIGMYIPLGTGVHLTGSSAGSYMHADTINEVRATGSFRRVRFRILEVVDTLSGVAGDPDNALLLRQSDSTARFVWTDQDRRQQAVFLVRIEGEATPRIPESVTDPDLRAHVSRILEERNLLRDTAEFYVNVVSLEEIIAELRAEQAPGVSPDVDTAGDSLSPDEVIRRFLQQTPFRSLNRFAAVVLQPQIYSNPSGRWTQRVVISGVDPESVSVASPSGVRIVGRTATSIDVSSTSPATGTHSIRLKLRADEDEAVTVEFEVRSVSVDRPSVPATIYAGTGYDIDLRMNQIDAGRMTIDIVENGAIRREGAEPRFRYTPSASAGNGEFVLYVDGERFDSYRFSISQIPNPELVLLRDHGDSVVVQSVSWGEHGGRWNRSIVAIKAGQNAGEPQLIDEEIDSHNYRIRRTWSVRRLDRSRSADLLLRAYDQRGLSHETVLKITGTQR
jgi:hypothetical protein